ncbi:MAG: YcfL family protein [Azoarcus sp.]|nr:YcfL family protein [Azoarcus sp.]
MKRMTMTFALGLACLGLALPVYSADGGSIAGKVEELGQMDYLEVTDLRAVRRDGLLRVQATVSNSSPGNQQLYYRFRWLDSDGFAVWEEEPWKPELVYGKQNKVLNVVAPTFKATDFKLELQSPNNSTSAEGSGSVADKPPYR